MLNFVEWKWCFLFASADALIFVLPMMVFVVDNFLSQRRKLRLKVQAKLRSMFLEKDCIQAGSVAWTDKSHWIC